MASPQLENGYTPISNELLEAMLRTSLSARELKTVLALARETYGWHRKTVVISTYRLAATAGLQRGKTARALQTLKARKIVTNGSAGLGLNKDYEAWLPATPRGGPIRTRVQFGYVFSIQTGPPS